MGKLMELLKHIFGVDHNPTPMTERERVQKVIEWQKLRLKALDETAKAMGAKRK